MELDTEPQLRRLCKAGAAQHSAAQSWPLKLRAAVVTTLDSAQPADKEQHSSDDRMLRELKEIGAALREMKADRTARPSKAGKAVIASLGAALADHGHF